MSTGCCGPHHNLRSADFPARATIANPAEATTARPPILWCDIPAGAFAMGNDGQDANPGDAEGPVRTVLVDAFQVSATSVTNAQFAQFVRATHYMTDAERLGSSYVFHLQMPEAIRRGAQLAVDGLPWWRFVEHASWQRPEGPGSHVSTREGHPVVHVSWNDANAYCAWAQCRLPSETQWERAARGGLEGMKFAWGDELFDAHGVPRCNVYRGSFPDQPLQGWSPGPIEAAAGHANGFGLFNVCGNVWEWCSDQGDLEQRALRGGSFLCHESYCNRYRVAARSWNTRDTSSSNIGFRIVR